MCVVAGIDYLGRDPDLIAGAEHRAVHYRIDIELASDLRQWLPGTLVQHRRGSRNHPERADLAQRRNQLVGHAIGEVLLRHITGQILERQDGEGVDWRDRRSRIAVRTTRTTSENNRDREPRDAPDAP